ncbi:swr1 complex component [Sorochytrium milnesiophthora]
MCPPPSKRGRPPRSYYDQLTKLMQQEQSGEQPPPASQESERLPPRRRSSTADQQQPVTERSAPQPTVKYGKHQRAVHHAKKHRKVRLPTVPTVSNASTAFYKLPDLGAFTEACLANGAMPSKASAVPADTGADLAALQTQLAATLEQYERAQSEAFALRNGHSLLYLDVLCPSIFRMRSSDAATQAAEEEYKPLLTQLKGRVKGKSDKSKEAAAIAAQQQELQESKLHTDDKADALSHTPAPGRKLLSEKSSKYKRYTALRDSGSPSEADDESTVDEPVKKSKRHHRPKKYDPFAFTEDAEEADTADDRGQESSAYEDDSANPAAHSVVESRGYKRKRSQRERGSHASSLHRPARRGAAARADESGNPTPDVSSDDVTILPSSLPMDQPIPKHIQQQIKHTMHPLFGSVRAYLDSFAMFSDEDHIPRAQLDADLARTATLVYHMSQLRNRGRTLGFTDLKDVLPKRMEDYPRDVKDHRFFVMNEMKHVRGEVIDAGRARMALARKCARMIERYWADIRNAGRRAKDVEAKRMRRLAKATAHEVRKRWKLIEMVVLGKQRELESVEQARLGKQQLNAMLEHSTAVLGAQQAHLLGRRNYDAQEEADENEESSAGEERSESDSGDEVLSRPPSPSVEGSASEEEEDLGTSSPAPQSSSVFGSTRVNDARRATVRSSTPLLAPSTRAPSVSAVTMPRDAATTTLLGGHADSDGDLGEDFDDAGADEADLEDTIAAEEQAEDADEERAELSGLQNDLDLTPQELLAKHYGITLGEPNGHSNQSDSDDGKWQTDDHDSEDAGASTAESAPTSDAEDADEAQESSSDDTVDEDAANEEESSLLAQFFHTADSGQPLQDDADDDYQEDEDEDESDEQDDESDDEEEDDEEEEEEDGEDEAAKVQDAGEVESKQSSHLIDAPTGSTLASTQVKTEVPFLLRGSLREYQHVGLDWLASLYENNLNGILADEMGLGKTIQTIALLAHLACDKGIWGPHLIVVPTSVMLNWEMELKRWCPAFKVLTYYGTVKERKEKRTGWTKSNAFHVCITSYQLVVTDQKVFRRKAWEYLILDEAHNIKNFRSQRWQTLLNFNSRRRLLLTGTPLQNNLMELWSLLYFLMPNGATSALPTGFASQKDFQDWFSRPVDQVVESIERMDEEMRATITRLHTILRPFILRRLKSEVEKQMPGKYEHIVLCRLSKRQRFLYDDFMSRAQTKETLASGSFLSIIGCLMQLRKVCNHPDMFEVRPIVTSFAMQRGVSSDYQIKELLVRRRLLAGVSDGSVDLAALASWGLHLASGARVQGRKSGDDPYVDGLSVSIARCTVAQQTLEERFLQPRGNESIERRCRTRFQLQQTRMTLDRLKYMQRMQQQRHTATQHHQGHALSFTASFINLLSGACRRSNDFWVACDPSGGMSHSHVLSSLVLPHVRREQVMHEALLKFSMATPKIKVMSGYETEPEMRICSHPDVARSFAPQVDFLHPVRQALSIAFPEKWLLQYDCGKLQKLEALLRELKLGGHRVLIFTQMTKMLDILEIFLNLHGHRYLRLDGATKPEQRQLLTERFNNDQRILVFISSTRAGGIGINLTAADTVIFYDSDWNPSMDAQAQDRVHRIGQTRDVHIYRLVSEHTIEENILRKARQKRLLDQIVIQDAGFTTDALKSLDWRDLFVVDETETLATASVTNAAAPAMSTAELEQALVQAEDEADVQALQQSKRELAYELDDFVEGSEATQAPAAAPMNAAGISLAVGAGEQGAGGDVAEDTPIAVTYGGGEQVIIRSVDDYMFRQRCRDVLGKFEQEWLDHHHISADDSFRMIFSAYNRTFFLHMKPNPHVVHPDATVEVHREDGTVERKPLRDAARVYAGTVYADREQSDRQWELQHMGVDAAVDFSQPADQLLPTAAVDKARIVMHHDGMSADASLAAHYPATERPVLYAQFTWQGDHYSVVPTHIRNVQKRSTEASVMSISSRPQHLRDATMMVYRESDTRAGLRKRQLAQGVLRDRGTHVSCGAHELAYNRNQTQFVDTSFGFASPFHALLRRQTATTTTPPAGCPADLKFVYMGVAADCAYSSTFGNSEKDITAELIQTWDTVRNLYEQDFRVGVGIQTLTVRLQCGPEPWNQPCSFSYPLDARLNDFSQWRAQQTSDEGLWHLLTNCPSSPSPGAAPKLGLAWTGAICNTTLSPSSKSDGSTDYFLGTGVSSKIPVQWKVVAHEIGHNFGAIHDCTQDSCQQQGIGNLGRSTKKETLLNSNSSQCEPCAPKCDCNSAFLMNPTDLLALAG